MNHLSLQEKEQLGAFASFILSEFSEVKPLIGKKT